jgi:hypothetical protein
MKTKIVIANLLFVAVIASSQITSADNRIKSLTDREKEQIAWALKILIKTKTMTLDEERCEKIDCSILDLLQKEGLIQESDLTTQAICVVPM